MKLLKPFHDAYLWLRYSLPLWIDAHTAPPLLRTVKHRFFCRTHAARCRAVERLYEIAFGRPLDLQNPQTFNEKIQWLKLFYPNPLIPICADKFRVREHICETIGEKYLTPLFAACDRPEEIDFDALPDQFALKVNWGSGQNLLCRDKSRLDRPSARKLLRKWLKPARNQYFFALEWGYRDIPPKIVCEKYLSFLESNPYVFKIMCFNGEPRVIQLVIDDKTPKETINYYDTEWNLLPFRQNFPTNSNPIPKPAFLDEMLTLARKLSEPFPFVRVDFFEGPEQLVFSEMTFYSDAGTARFEPEEWDLKLGQMMTLPEPEVR